MSPKTDETIATTMSATLLSSGTARCSNTSGYMVSDVVGG